LEQADRVKAALQQSFKEKGISRYWNVETYREFEFTKEIMRELQSQKNLFMLIAVVIILVACSNIISMLIILVNDKKTEIGILRSMGASSKSIALIFGFSGAIIGVLGSVGGIAAAILTLHHLETLVALLSRLQGHDMFSANLYGQVLPSELSLEALSFVLIATVCISLLAGIIPAIKASLLRPSHILRSSGA
jgi:lipoprotein-releasing system permease protein